LQPPQRPNMIPGPGSKIKVLKGKKNPLDAWEIEGRAFAAQMLPPGQTASGFFYFQTAAAATRHSVHQWHERSCHRQRDPVLRNSASLVRYAGPHVRPRPCLCRAIPAQESCFCGYCDCHHRARNRASTAIFSVTSAVLLRPLPYKDPDRLTFVISDMQKRNVKDFPFSNADFVDLRNQTSDAFEEMGAVLTNRATLPGDNGSDAEMLRIGNVTTNFFHMMGGKIALGRDFNDGDGLPQPVPTPGAAAAPARLPAIAILSHQYWKRHFGGRADIIGKPLLPSAPGADRHRRRTGPGLRTAVSNGRQSGARARCLVRESHRV